MTTKLIDAKILNELCLNILITNGVKTRHARAVVDALIWASLRGIDSHGVRLIPHYLEGIKQGRINTNPQINFVNKGDAIGVLDADDSFGHYAGEKAMQYSLDLAKKNGIGAVTVKNSSHCGGLTYYGHLAAEKNMLGICMTHATARVRTPLSNRAFFGNNPVCIVAPMNNEEPFCFDASTTGITFNAVRAAAASGEMIKDGLIADENGLETNDPNKAQQLIPIGDYKGFGLSMVVDIFCALLTGMPNGNNVSEMFGSRMNQKRKLGQFYCAIDISKFIDINLFKEDLYKMIQRLRNEPNIYFQGENITVPGDPEKKEFRKRSEFGIPVLKKDLEDIESLLL